MIDDHPLILLAVILILFALILMIITLVHLFVQQIPMSPDWSNYENLSYNLSEWLV